MNDDVVVTEFNSESIGQFIIGIGGTDSRRLLLTPEQVDSFLECILAFIEQMELAEFPVESDVDNCWQKQ